ANVGDVLVGLQSETKVRTDIRYPPRRSLLRQLAAKGVVHFDRRELRRVVLQEVFRRNFLRIEVGLPDGVRPTRGADVERETGSVESRSSRADWFYSGRGIVFFLADRTHCAGNNITRVCVSEVPSWRRRLCSSRVGWLLSSLARWAPQRASAQLRASPTRPPLT